MQIDNGYLGLQYRSSPLATWLVRDGDVAPDTEPATMLLIGLGLMGMAGGRRKIKK